MCYQVRMRPLASVVLLWILTGCGEDPSSQIDNQYEHMAYHDVNPDAPLAGQSRTELLRALTVLDAAAEQSDTPRSRDLARLTLQRIAAGDVLLGSIEGSRGIDRWHMCKDYALTPCAGSRPDDDGWTGGDGVTAQLAADLDGYQWGNRLYFTLEGDVDSEEVAATLVHEVNHVLNRSECSYYEDIEAHRVDQNLAFVEEYRAFFTECLFSHDAAASVDGCNAQTLDHLEAYELEPDLAALLPEGETDPVVMGALIAEGAAYGKTMPTADAWPDSFAACSCNGAERDASGVCRNAVGQFAPASCCE